MSPDDLPVVEFAFPGPLRNQLVAAILGGTKTTSSLLAGYGPDEALPRPGLQQAVVDSSGP